MDSKTVLVVEDNQLNMKLVRELLKIAGCSSLEAVDAEMGLKLARKHRPDLILMDIQLPGMDGLSATQIIKNDSELNETPVIALTSYAMKGDETKAKQAGCDGYLTKPINTKAFLKTIGNFFSLRQTVPEQKSKPSKKRVLIVDDEPLNVKLLKAKLSKEPYEIITAYNGHEALESVSKKMPDLILLDIMMPDIDGYQVTRTLKNDPRTQHIPIILVTALNGKEDKRKGLESGADEFLNKPVNSLELKARARSLIQLKTYQDQFEAQPPSKENSKPTDNSDKSNACLISDPIQNSFQNILIVEDNEKDIRLIENYLHGQNYRLHFAQSGEEAISKLQNENIDLVLLDILLDGMNGFEVCRQLKGNDLTYNIQVVVITSLDDLKSKIKGIELGADDFLIKPVNSLELNARVKALLKKKAYMDRLVECYETALNAAQTDKLTGLFNYSYFRQFLDLEIKRCKRQKHSLSLIMIDIDDFKNYNNQFGPLEGDRLIKELGQVIKASIREIDVLARYGGEEFILALPYTDIANAQSVAERILSKVDDTFDPRKTDQCKDKMTVSMGISSYNDALHCSDDFIKNTENALFQCKREGKNGLCVFNADLNSVLSRKN
jgi:two-component system cell cycle response regulator